MLWHETPQIKKVNGNVHLEHRPLETDCPHGCDGKSKNVGGYYYYPPDYMICTVCAGTGKALTKEGRLLLEFMLRHVGLRGGNLSIPAKEQAEKENDVKII